ncbi:MAG: NlpC/P60 family protein [Elusimicrobiaceae bacterium]|nr:NlpC/P60 family protein [Elusimicrobiaceae bacterium]
MTATLLSFIQSGLCHAGNFCKQLYPSCTAVFVNAAELKTAKTDNLERRELPDGLFSVIRAAGGRKSSGTLQSGVITAAFPFDRLVLSVNAFLPPKSFLLAEIQAGTTDKTGKPVWSRWYRIGKFNPEGASASFGPQQDAFGAVDTDQLVLKTRMRFCRFRVTMQTRSIIMPVLRLAALNFSDSGAGYSQRQAVKSLSAVFPGRPGWLNPVRDLAVPARSQRGEKELDADSICSPVSLGMTMEYFGARLTNTEIAGRVYDAKTDIFGNWFFNTAYAGSKGLYSFVEKFNSLAQAERAVALGYPVTASITYGSGGLKNAPVNATKGHLVVIRGFDARGGVLVNDPAAEKEKDVPRRYQRAQFARAWLKNKNGLAYRVENRFPRVMRIGVPLAGLHSQPGADGKPGALQSQFFLNEAVLVKSFKNGWAEVESLEQGYYTGAPCADDIDSCWRGYPGWVKADTLGWGSAYGYAYTVAKPETEAISLQDGKEKPVKLFMGTRLCPLTRSAPAKKGYTTVALPDCAPLFVKTRDLLACPEGLDPAGLRRGAAELARVFENAAYRWGGRTINGIDCSGLVNLVYRVYGINLPRNADAQYRATPAVSPGELEPGDLVFVSKKNEPGEMEHVLLYTGGEDLIEACRNKKQVAETTFKKRFGKKLKDLKQGEQTDGHSIHFRKAVKDS